MSKNENILIDENVVNIKTVIETDAAQVEDVQENINIAATAQEESSISEEEVVDIQVEEAFPYNAEIDALNHSLLNNRDAENSHPIGAIEGLEKELQDIKSTKRVYSLENGLAEFIQWSDENPSWEDRSGYFVKLTYNTDTGTAYVDVCTDKDDVYGISVRNSGFVGNQVDDESGNGRSDDPTYAMVGIVGLLRVRTDGTASIGDYIVPSAAGIATKSEYDCGYRVVSHGSYPSYNFVTIAVTPQNDRLSKIYGMLMESDDSIGNISLRIDEIESELSDASNKINVSINDYNELKDLVDEHEVAIDGFQQITNEVRDSAQQAIDDAQQAIQDANNARDEAQAAAKDARDVADDLSYVTELADEMQVIVEYSYTDEDGNTYSGAGGVVQSVTDNRIAIGDMVTSVNAQGEEIAAALVLANESGAAIQHLVNHIDKYSIGELSLSYGLTHEEAKSILVNDYIYVPTSNHEETLAGSTTIDPETGEEIVSPDVVIQFERGYAYTWDCENGTWVKGDAISTATTYSDGANVGDLWYCFQDVEGPNGEYYIAETLYRWYGHKWIAVASMRDNYRSRIMTSIMQTSDQIESKVVALDGSLSLVTQDVEQISSRVADVEGNISTIDQEVDNINLTIGNIDGTIASISERVSENEAKISMVTYGAFHIVHQSFDSAAPDPIDGKRYSVPPTWNDTTEEFEFNEAMLDDSGAYYFHSEDNTKYIKVLDDGGYEVYTVGNKALSAINSRISETEATLDTVVELVGENSDAIAGISAKATENEASINYIASYYYHTLISSGTEKVANATTQKYTEPPEWSFTENKYIFPSGSASASGTYYYADVDKQTYCKVITAADGSTIYEVYGVSNNALAAVQQKADENGATIGLVVEDGNVKGDVIISAINGESVAQIDAGRVVFSVNTSSEEHLDYSALMLDTTLDVSGAEYEHVGMIATEYISLDIKAESPLTMTVYGLDSEVIASEAWLQRVAWYDENKTCLLTAPISAEDIYKNEADGMEEIAPNYTNVLPSQSYASDLTSVYNGTGYKDGYYLDDSGNEVAMSGYSLTGRIPFVVGQTIRTKNIDFSAGANNYIFFYFFKADGTFYRRIGRNNMIGTGTYDYGANIDENGDITYTMSNERITVSTGETSTYSFADAAYIVLGFVTPSSWDDVAITIDEEFTYKVKRAVPYDALSIDLDYLSGEKLPDTLLSEVAYVRASFTIEKANGINLFPEQFYDADLTSIYNGTGYKENTYIADNGKEYEITGYSMTGRIPLTTEQTLRTRGVSFSAGADGYVFACFFDSTGALIKRTTRTNFSTFGISIDGNGDITCTINNDSVSDMAYIAFCISTPASWDNFVVLVDEEFVDLSLEDIADAEIYFGEHDYYGQFRMILNDHQATIQNGELKIVNPYNRILLNPDDGIRVQTNTNVVDGVVSTKNPIWTDMFYTETETGNTYAGGWLLSSGSLSSGKENTYVNFNSDPEQTYTLWAGAENPEEASFSVTKEGKLYATGAHIEGDITLSAGSTISWSNISNKPTIPTIPSYITSTKITETTIESPSIYGGTFCALSGEDETHSTMAGTYSTMTAKGFYIYRGASGDEPKLSLTASTDAVDGEVYGSEIRVTVGAGDNNQEHENSGKLIMEKKAEQQADGTWYSYAMLYYTNETGIEYGFKFDSNGVTMLNGVFEAGTQAYAVFG